MQQPPSSSDPYDFVDPSQINRGSLGCLVAWGFMREFWGGVINEAWSDMNVLQVQESRL